MICKKTCLWSVFFFIQNTIISSLQANSDHALFSASGYIDGSYNHLDSANQFMSGVYNRAFDTDENGFTLHQAALTLDMLPSKGLGASLNVILGKDAFVIAAYGFDPDIGSQEIGIDLTQAWVQYTFSTQWNIALGKFVTLAGYETINPTTDPTFSRSELFTFAIPFTVSGFRVNYTPNTKWKATAGILEGWDTIRAVNKSPTFELGIYYSPCKEVNFSAIGYLGHEQVIAKTDEGPIGSRELVNFILSYQPREKTRLAIDYDYGIQNNTEIVIDNTNKAIWQGIAGYFIEKLGSKWEFCLRGEVFQDRNGYRTGEKQVLKEATLSLLYKPIKNVMLRAETRRDVSNQDSFMSKTSGDPRDYQQSYALEGIYLFL